MTLKDQTRDEITSKLREYLEDNSLSINAFARKSNINASFISQMLNRKGEIKDRWYKQVAEYINFSIVKHYWPLRNTSEFKEVIAAIKTARELQRNRTIIGETGCGKTTAAQQYCKKFPKHSYLVTITGKHTANAIYEDICGLLNLNKSGTSLKKERRITECLMGLRLKGENPVLIFDEAENMSEKTMQSIKSLYDALEGHCPIVLLGTSQLIEKLDVMTSRNKQGIPQFYSRFKAGLIQLDPIDRNYSDFVDNIKDKNLIHLLNRLCTDYRELHDRVVYAIQDTEKRGVELTCEEFKLIYNIND